MIVPMTLMATWIAVTLLASLLTPIEESIAVIQVPILAPMMIGIAIPHVSLPVREILCRIPIDAAELWITPVTIMPASTPRRGKLNAVRILVKLSISRRGAMEPDIMVIPCIRIAKPTSIVPISFFFCFLDAMISKMPISANISEKHLGSKSLRNMLSLLSIPDRDRIHAVSVVPISEPNITPIVCPRSMIPELTKPTSITVIAEDDWMAIVMIAPIAKPLKGLSVAFLNNFSSLPPAVFLRESDRSFIP